MKKDLIYKEVEVGYGDNNGFNVWRIILLLFKALNLCLYDMKSDYK